jgi:pilus assembly protein CpaE
MREIGRAAAFLLDADAPIGTVLTRALAARNVELTLRSGGLESALNEAGQNFAYDCIIVDVRHVGDPVEDLAALQSILPRHCRLIAFAERLTSDLHRDLIDAGAYAVLDITLRPDTLDAIFGTVVQTAENNEGVASAPRKRGRVIALLGTRGGVGTSTTATGLAWMLAHDLGRETALLDLDPFFGSTALALNIDPGDGMRQALEQPSRLDSVFIDRAVRRVGDRLYVLSTENALDQPLATDDKAPVALVEALRNQYERVVVDLPRGHQGWQTRVLARADEVLLVTDLSLAGARDTMRLLAFARHCSSSSRIRIVVGGARQPQNEMLDLAEFRRAVGAPVELNIPFDAAAAMAAGRRGQPLPKAGPRTPSGKAYRTLLTALEGAAEDPGRGRRLMPWRR